MAETDMADVFTLLEKLGTVDEETIGTIETERITAADPESSLIDLWEPDFVDGYELTTTTGHAITLDTIWEAHQAGENILLVGPSGTGKSSIAFHLLDKANEKARIKNREIYQKNLKLLKDGDEKKEVELIPYHALPHEIAHLSCHEGTRSEHLTGTVTVMLKEDGTRIPVRVLGAVTDAWINGKTLIAEEIDFAPPGVWGEAHQFFDGRTRETTIYINGPEKIRKNKKFRVIATANTLGAGENQIAFSGTQVLNGAFMNRFTYVVLVDYLERTKEIGLICSKAGIKIGLATAMVDAAIQTRKSMREGATDVAITTRDLLSWGRECTRAIKRRGSEPADVKVLWNEIAVPSAYPSFLSRIADLATREAFQTYVKIR